MTISFEYLRGISILDQPCQSYSCCAEVSAKGFQKLCVVFILAFEFNLFPKGELIRNSPSGSPGFKDKFSFHKNGNFVLPYQDASILSHSLWRLMDGKLFYLSIILSALVVLGFSAVSCLASRVNDFKIVYAVLRRCWVSLVQIQINIKTFAKFGTHVI